MPPKKKTAARKAPKKQKSFEETLWDTANTKNHNLGLAVSYMLGSDSKTYVPDSVLLVDNGQGPDDPLQLIIEVKGYRGKDAKDKKETMETRWIPGVNQLGTHHRWAFAEFTDTWEMASDLENKFTEQLSSIIPAA